MTSQTHRSSSQQWCRFSAYEVRDGYLRPAKGATLEFYDPWEEYWATVERAKRDAQPPYQSLFALLKSQAPDPDQPLTPKAERALLAWCARYGLLGILLQQVSMVFFAPRMARPSASTERDHGIRLAAGKRLPIQVRYIREGGTWTAATQTVHEGKTGTLAESRFGRENSIPANRYSSGFKDCGPPTARDPVPTLWPTTAGVLSGPPGSPPEFLSLEDAWWPFFPGLGRNQQPPPPHSRRFWEHYAEPVSTFLHTARNFQFAAESYLINRLGLLYDDDIDALWKAIRGTDILHGLLAPVSPTITIEKHGDGAAQPRWRAPSLLGIFATMLFEDLTTDSTLRECSVCSTLFLSGAHAAEYCSSRCRWRENKRKVRHKRALASKAKRRATPARRRPR